MWTDLLIDFAIGLAGGAGLACALAWATRTGDRSERLRGDAKGI